jgi:hypothetical protein
MQWSQLKKRIEERLAKSVRSRVVLGSTTYRHSHDMEGRGWIAIDKQEILNIPTTTVINLMNLTFMSAIPQ